MDLVPHLLFLREIDLVELVELLALAELSLLLLKLFSHSNLTIPGSCALILFFLVGAQHGVLVQGGPFVNLIVKATHIAISIVVLVLLHNAKVLL